MRDTISQPATGQDMTREHLQAAYPCDAEEETGLLARHGHDITELEAIRSAEAPAGAAVAAVNARQEADR